MPRMTICSHPGCPNLTPANGTGRCDLHKPKAWANTSPSRAGRPKDWERRRVKTLKRDNYRCVRCGAPAREVDHVVPVAEGGGHDLDNLQVLCARHHREKTNQEKARRRWPA